MVARSKHAVAVHRAARLIEAPGVARKLQSPLLSDLSSLNVRTEPLEAPSARLQRLVAGFALSRTQERVRQESEAPILRLGPEWVEVSRRPVLSPEQWRAPARLRQIMLERLSVQRAENYRKLRLLSAFVAPRVFGMTLRCLERKARREALFARARLEKQEGRGNGRPRPRKRHWRRSYYSLIGC